MDRELLSGREINAGCSGTYEKIQEAIDEASDGDVILVCPGIYYEKLSIVGKALTLRSTEGAAATVIDAGSGGKALSVTTGASVIVDGFTFNGGSTISTGGNVHCNWAGLELRNSILSAGRAFKGGGLGATECTGIVENNLFSGNVASYYGGGAYIKGDSLAFENNTVRSNDAAMAGGGLYVEGSSAIADNHFEGNHSDKFAGAAYVLQSYGDIIGNTLVVNTAGDDGGGIFVSFGAPLVDGNTFERNDASDEGGGLRVKLAEATITNNTFLENHADYRGGGTRISHDEVVMSGNTFIGNHTWVDGGAVMLFESASVLTDEVYEDNEARNGGALVIEAGWGDVLVQDCTFDGNSADEQGGQLWINLIGHTTRLQRVTLRGGSAEQGGAVYALASDILFENTLFEKHQAEDSGGALYLDGATGTILNSVVARSEAPEGSALTVVNGTTLDVRNNAFYKNAAGAAVRLISGMPPSMRYNAFSENSDNFSGMSDLIGSDGNLSADPAFVDPEAGDFHLQWGSPLINAGDPSLSDPDGSRSDIGLYGGPRAH